MSSINANVKNREMLLKSRIFAFLYFTYSIISQRKKCVNILRIKTSSKEEFFVFFWENIYLSLTFYDKRIILDLWNFTNTKMIL